ncbi:MAG TPA: right-handed parallel beta-helix repeat-containing protein, partial [Alphaproteobacteria bacterium]|nr:right-handed parallel beta-helix repeat-containing protein [Alphaproteobacteria bacterium]
MPAQQRHRGKLYTALLLAALLLAGSVIAPVATANVDPAVTATVTTSADTLGGDTSSFAALSASPGPDGAISLREAITAANNTPASAGPLLISFDISPNDPNHDAARGVWTIYLDSALPPLSRGAITIDGGTQAPAATSPRIVLDGSLMYEPEHEYTGITITSAGNTIRRLALVYFYDAGIVIKTAEARGNRVVGSAIGIRPDEDTAEPNFYGVQLRSGASDNQIGGSERDERNVISGNEAYGVMISGAATTRNVVAGNIIGLGHQGNRAVGNVHRGVMVDGAPENTIGLPGAGNVIGGNKIGVELTNGALRNLVAGNVIGLADDGTTTRADPGDESTTLGNTDGGIFITRGSYENTIGGLTAAFRNIIANNGYQTDYGDGIFIDGSGTRANRVLGNYIGVDRAGNRGRGNLRYGVSITSTAVGNMIGDAAESAGNVIAYNGRGGIRISSTANQVAGNLIGLGADGTPLGNQENGVDVDGEANVVGPDNVIAYNQLSGIVVNGGSTSVFSNVLHDNDHSGICVAGSDTTVTNNDVFENGGRTTSRANCNIQGGIVVDDASRTAISANVVHDNHDVGIRISGGVGNRILSNSISKNAQAGIKLEAGGNEGIAAPVIVVAYELVSGQGCG